jgi:hypothetical protein
MLDHGTTGNDGAFRGCSRAKNRKQQGLKAITDAKIAGLKAGHEQRRIAAP